MEIDTRILADMIMNIGGNGTLKSGPDQLKNPNIFTAEIDAYGTEYDMTLNVEDGMLTLSEFQNEDDYDEDGYDEDGNEQGEPDTFSASFSNMEELESALMIFFKSFETEWIPGSEPKAYTQ